MQVSVNKLSLSFFVILLSELFFFCNIVFANNASYIALSSQIARKKQLDVVANNVANANTVGFEQDNILFRPVDVKQSAKRNNTFTWSETTYRSGASGGIKITHRPTDIAIGGEGYFKVATPRGPRYTLDGAMLINNQGVLVNTSGFPYLSPDDNLVEIPDEFQNLEIAQSGVVFVDGEEVGMIGVFSFNSNNDPIIKEGGNLYAIEGASFPLEEYTIISGALRESNVNSTLAMAQMVEMQRSFGLTASLSTNISETETSAINKLSK